MTTATPESRLVAALSPQDRRALIRKVQLERAKTNFRQFLEFVITEDADGNACSLPISILNDLPDPLPDYKRPPKWEHVEEMAADLMSGQSLIYLKSRQMLFSWVLAAYALFRALERGRGFVLSMGQDEADEVIRKIKYIRERLPRELNLPEDAYNQSHVGFKKAGDVKSFPSTENAVRSLSGRLVLSDEAAFHRYAQENFRAYQPAIGADGGQHVVISTGNGPFGWFHSFFMAAYHGENDYVWRFYPWNARPDRDKGWYERTKRAYTGFLADFYREYPSSIEEAFSQLSGVVYPSFNPVVHVAPPLVPFEQCWLRGAGVDWGGSPGNPNAAGVFGVTREGHVHQYDEWIGEGTIDISELGGFLARWKARAPLITVECDWQNDTGIQVLRAQFGLPARRAIKKREGLDMLDFLLTNNRFSVDPRCTRAIDEFFGYRWREALDPNSRERYQTKTPVDHHAEQMDLRRYFLARLWKLIFNPLTAVQSASGRPARKYVA